MNIRGKFWVRRLGTGAALVIGLAGGAQAQSCDQALGPGLADLKRVGQILDAQQAIYVKQANEFAEAAKANKATFEDSVRLRMLSVGHCARMEEAFVVYETVRKALNSKSCASRPQAAKEAFAKSGEGIKGGLDGCRAGLKQIDSGLEDMRPK